MAVLGQVLTISSTQTAKRPRSVMNFVFTRCLFCVEYDYWTFEFYRAVGNDHYCSRSLLLQRVDRCYF